MMPPKHRWVTMKQVAEAANVSAITISRVLRQPHRVRPKTRERVEAAIRELGYVPDEAAGALSSRRSRIVGALVSTLAGSIFASTVDGLSSALRGAGYQLLLAGTDYTPTIEEASIAALLGRRPDGLVLTSTEHTDATRQLLRNANVPVIEVWEIPQSPIDCAVGFSNRDAGRAMTEYLAMSGRRRIGFIGSGNHAEARGRLRLQGYTDALQGRSPKSLRAVAVDAAVDGPEAGARGLGELLQRWPDTDAIFCVNDHLALGAVCEARRRGLEVPGKLAIAGFGDFELASAHGLALTTVRVPGFAIGEEAARLIVENPGTAADKPRVVDLGFKIIRRETA